MKIYVTLLLFLAPHFASAEALTGLSSYFESKVASAQQGVAASPIAANETDFQLQDFYFEIAPEAVFGLTSFVSLTVAPEIDLVFTPIAKAP